MLLFYIDIDPITMVSNNIRHINVAKRLMIDEDTWPPHNLKKFIPLLLVYYSSDHSLKTMAQKSGNTLIDRQASPKQYKDNASQRIFDGSVKTREIKDIVAPLENNHESCLILIEGAPGIGKTVLLEEIAYQWGKKHILQNFKIVLLICLRNHIFQQVKQISDLLHLCFKYNLDEVKMISKYFRVNEGKDLVFLFDGLDELPKNLRKEGLIADILGRRILPLCGLVVSSRPHASHYLRHQATLIVQILGFTEVEQMCYIQQALKENESHEIEKYFKHHLTIAGLCCIPFNLVVLLYLYKRGEPLPKNCTELYSKFICITISRNLARHDYKYLEGNITEWTNLPQPYNEIIYQLAKLSLEALNNNKLIFSLDEIKTACPDLDPDKTTIPGAINGFGLLEAVPCFGITGIAMTFNFLHFSIQEYLAAYHLTKLSTQEELKIIEEKFWNDNHHNMFSMYVVLTQGQRPSFKQFLSGGDKALLISEKFLNDQRQCFHLYHCFFEAHDVERCKTIETSKTFSDKKINLCYTPLTTTDVECVAVFLASSCNKEWEELNLSHCYMQDHGFHILHHRLIHCNDLTINNLELCNNGLTKRSAALIREITVKCKVKTLDINENDTIGEDQQLYSMLTDRSTILVGLYLYHTKLSYSGAISLFSSLENNTTLKWLSINNNDVTDDACSAITTAMKNNSCLVTLGMYGNPLTGEGIVNIVKSLQENNRLELIWLPRRLDYNNIISSLEGDINKKRQSRGCQVKLGIGYGRF